MLERLYTLIKKINKTQLLVSLFVLVTLLSLYFIYSLTRNNQVIESIPKPEVETIRNTDLSNTQIDFQASMPNIPKSLPVYKVSSVLLNFEELQQQFGVSVRRNNFIFQDSTGRKVLEYNQQNDRFDFYDSIINGHDDPASAMLINPQEALDIATNFVNNNFNNFQALPLTDEIVYYNKFDPHGEETSLDKANAADIPFTLIPQNVNAFIGIDKQPPLTIYVDSNNKVMGFKVKREMFTINEHIEVETIGFQEMIQSLQNNQAEIIRIIAETQEQFELRNITNLLIQTVEVEYRYSSTDKIVTPYFRVTAQAVMRNISQPAVVEFIVLAVKSQSESE